MGLSVEFYYTNRSWNLLPQLQSSYNDISLYITMPLTLSALHTIGILAMLLKLKAHLRSELMFRYISKAKPSVKILKYYVKFSYNHH